MARIVAAALAVCAFAGPAAARDPVAAEALFRAGRDALRRGDYEAACSAFEASQRLDPAGGTALNLAECEQGRGHVASAWQHLREALDLLPSGDDRIPLARARVKELEPRLPHLTIRLASDAPPGATVTRDGVEVTGAMLGFAQPIDPGRHVVRVEAPQHASQTYDVVATEGQARVIEIEPGDVLPEAKGPPWMTGRRKAGLIVGGFGLAAVGVGLAEGFAVVSRGDQKSRLCPGNVCPDAERAALAHDVDSSGKTLSLLSTVTCGVGAAALAVGTLLVVSGAPSERGPAVSVAPVAGARGAVIGVGGAF